MFLARNSPAVLDGFTGDDRAVAEYLLAEVFASQPPAMRDSCCAPAFLNA
jgi:ATP/maltotriose-dependent transcriptional regulator MalT